MVQGEEEMTIDYAAGGSSQSNQYWKNTNNAGGNDAAGGELSQTGTIKDWAGHVTMARLSAVTCQWHGGSCTGRVTIAQMSTKK